MDAFAYPEAVLIVRWLELFTMEGMIEGILYNTPAI